MYYYGICIYNYRGIYKMLKSNNTCCVLDYSFSKYDCFNSKELDIIKNNLKWEIEKLLKKEKTIRFISGMNIGFEMFFAKIILELKEKYRNIIFECALPDELQAVGWSEYDRESYYNILGKCDIENFISKKAYSNNITKRNKYMISSSKNVFIFTDIPDYLERKVNIYNDKNFIMIDTRHNKNT